MSRQEVLGMNTIDRISSIRKTSSKNIPVVPSSHQIVKENNWQNRKDSFSISDESSKDIDWNSALDNELEILAKSFPNVNIFIQESNDQQSLIQLAENLGYGRHLIISEQWLKQMAGSAEEFQKGKVILKKILTQLSSNKETVPASGAYLEPKGITFWNGVEQDEKLDQFDTHENYKAMLEQLKDITKKTPSFDSKFKTKVSSYTVAGLYSQLAGAGSKQQVRTAISEVHRNIGSLQLVSALGDTDERNKARAAIASLKKLLLKGNRKIQRLSSEEIVQLREKRARKQAEAERVLALKLELKKQRTNRKTADGSIVLEGRLEDLNNSYKTHSRKYDEYRYGKYSDYIMTSSFPPVSIPSVSSAGTGTLSSSLAIQISPAISLSDS